MAMMTLSRTQDPAAAAQWRAHCTGAVLTAPAAGRESAGYWAGKFNAGSGKRACQRESSHKLVLSFTGAIERGLQ